MYRIDEVGQMVSALRSGAYDLARTVLLMPQGGDACRGSNYTGVLRRAVKAAGFPQIPVLSLNVKGLEKGQQVRLEAGMVYRALFGLMYGDLLMILHNQVLPYERHPGDTKRCLDTWRQALAADLKTGRHLTLRQMKKNFIRIAEDFASIPRTGQQKQKVGIVGELYVKYCHLGNWNLEAFLTEENCEYYINGLSWYVLYYIGTHLTTEGALKGKLYATGLRFIRSLQRVMVNAIRGAGFFCLDEYSAWKQNAANYVCFHCTSADGWLIGAEAVNLIKSGYRKVIGIQPFDCMPNHICGRGLYPSLNRKLKEGHIVSVDVDASGSELNVRNRFKMLLDF